MSIASSFVYVFKLRFSSERTFERRDWHAFKTCVLRSMQHLTRGVCCIDQSNRNFHLISVVKPWQVQYVEHGLQLMYSTPLLFFSCWMRQRSQHKTLRPNTLCDPAMVMSVNQRWLTPLSAVSIGTRSCRPEDGFSDALCWLWLKTHF